MNETSTTNLVNGYSGVITTGGYSGTINGGTGTYISGDAFKINSTGNVSLGCTNPSATLTISNSNNMNTQSFVAVFTVERNEDNKVISSKFVKELWVEQKPGTSLELAVAKQLDKDFDPETTVIKTIYTVSF